MEAFDQFVLARKEDLKRIARHTRGEHAYGDVVNEAWVMAEAVSKRLQVPIDFLDAAFQRVLLGHLYQHLVRFLNVRHAVRLDQAAPGSDEATDTHPLLAARLRTTVQHALELPPPASMQVLKPWRGQRAVRIPRQLESDFDEELPLGITRGT